MSHTPSVVEGSIKRHGEVPFALGITAVFLVVGLVSIAFHEPWRDECQAWLLARDSTGLSTLLQNSRYEGTPVLWHLLLLPLTRLGGPSLMSGMNLAFAAAAVFLFAGFSPFDRMARALFAFGYLPLYEWGTIARSYAIGIFFLFLFATLFPRRRPILQGLVLALAANTSIHAAILAASALVLLVLDRVRPSAERHRGGSRFAFWTGICLAVAGLVISAVQILPPSEVLLVWVQSPSLARFWSVVYSLAGGFAPSVDCWFSSVSALQSPWIAWPLAIVALILTLAFLVTAGICLARRHSAWIVAAVSLSMLSCLFFYLWWRGPRHAGFLFIAILLALWLAPLFPERALADGWRFRLGAMVQKQLAGVLRAVLAFHVLVGALAVAVEVVTVFSAGRATADLVRQRGLSELPMVADPDIMATSVVAHLGSRAVYYPYVDHWGTFTIWGQHAQDGEEVATDDGVVFDRAARLADRSDVVVVLNRRPEGGAVTQVGAILAGNRAADVVQDESFWVYRVPRRAKINDTERASKD